MTGVFKNLIESLVTEPWLGFSRTVTAHMLERRLGQQVKARQYVPEPSSMLYVAASALPYHVSGYTTRTHEVIRALGLAGANVHSMTRPGYPGDRVDRLCDAASSETVVGDVRYVHAAAPANNRPVLFYALQAAQTVVQLAKRHKVAVIHAASNHVNALPALLAARALGIPFQYEMRGLWELTRISRMPEYEAGQGFKQGLQLEGLVARHADRLFVISEQLGRYAQNRWGVAAERMFLLPNCVTPDRFVVADREKIEPFTIGYAGSLIGYEGLDTLIEAVKLLAQKKVPVKVTIIGDGEARSALEEQVRRLGLSDRICFLGKMPPDSARAALGACALVCIPRKPFKVCEIVPPIKMVEALAMGKPVIVPDLPVFRDELGADPVGWFFKAGDPSNLALVVERALADTGTLLEMSQRARAYAVAQRSWENFVKNALPGSKDEV